MKSHRGRITNKKAFRVAARRYLQVRAEELKNLEEKRAALVEEMEGILNKAQEEERAFEESEQARFDEIEKEINAIDKTIEAKERARNLGNPGGKKKEDGENDDLTVEERAFVDYVRGTLTNERAANLTYADNGAGQTPVYIVIHNTDNYAKGANAKAHAKAQHDGNFKGYSAHVFVDDTEAYQALPYDRGAWHVGVNYGGRLFGTVNNRNAVGIEMCVQEGYNYEKAFQNTVQVCKQIMKQLGIPSDRVVQHYDVCAKNCPSAIRAKGDWNRFKQLIGAKTTTATVDKYYRTRKSWADSKSQIGAYKSLENAKKEWKEGYTIYDWNGKAVYPVEKTSAITLTKEIKVQLPVIKKGSSGAAVSSLQAVLGVEVDGSFGNDTETSLKVFQKNVAITADGSCGTDTWTKVFEHMKANTK